MRLNVIFQESEKEIALDFKELNERILIEFEGTQVVTEPDDLVKKLFARTGEINSNVSYDVGDYMFYNANFTSINLPNVLTAGEHSFSGCGNLINVNLPNLVTAGERCFDDCTSLISLEFPKALSFSKYCFESCNNLLSVKSPELSTLNSSMFYNCNNFLIADFGKISKLDVTTFTSTPRFCAIILRGETEVILKETCLPALIKAETIVGGQGYIYVPKALIESYQSNYSSLRFRAIEDYPQIIIHRWKRFTPGEGDYVFDRWGTTTSSLNKSETATTNVYTECKLNPSTGKMVGVGSYSAKTASAIKSGMEAGTTYYYRYSSTDVRKIVSVDDYTGTSTSYQYTIKYVSPQTTREKNWDDLSDETICVAHDPTYFPDKGNDGTYYYEKLDEYTFDVN